MLTLALARYLAANVVGLTFRPDDTGGNVFVEHLPSTPDRAVSIFSSGADPQPTKRPTDTPTVQVRVRSTKNDPRPGWDRAVAIYDALACLDNVVMDEGGDSETLVHSVTPIQAGPVAMGVDAQGRHEWSLNFRLRVHHPTRHRPPYVAIT